MRKYKKENRAFWTFILIEQKLWIIMVDRVLFFFFFPPLSSYLPISDGGTLTLLLIKAYSSPSFSIYSIGRIDIAQCQGRACDSAWPVRASHFPGNSDWRQLDIHFIQIWKLSSGLLREEHTLIWTLNLNLGRQRIEIWHSWQPSSPTGINQHRREQPWEKRRPGDIV